MKVYDRWGTLVYKSPDKNCDTKQACPVGCVSTVTAYVSTGVVKLKLPSPDRVMDSALLLLSVTDVLAASPVRVPPTV